PPPAARAGTGAWGRPSADRLGQRQEVGHDQVRRRPQALQRGSGPVDPGHRQPEGPGPEGVPAVRRHEQDPLRRQPEGLGGQLVDRRVRFEHAELVDRQHVLEALPQTGRRQPGFEHVGVAVGQDGQAPRRPQPVERLGHLGIGRDVEPGAEEAGPGLLVGHESVAVEGEVQGVARRGPEVLVAAHERAEPGVLQLLRPPQVDQGRRLGGDGGGRPSDGGDLEQRAVEIEGQGVDSVHGADSRAGWWPPMIRDVPDPPLPALARGRQLTFVALAAAIAVPGVVLSRLHEPSLPDALLAFLFGLAVIGAAFMLSWAAEAAQLDISAGLAIAVLAFIAVLPEYAVDLVFALKGGHAFAAHGPTCQSAADKLAGNDSPCALALANMTGSNRLLIGLGWTLVVFIAWRRYRRRGVSVDGVELERSHSVELAFLSVATVYSLTLPLKRTITLVDATILVALFIAYVIRISKAPAEEPHLVGPAALIGTFAVARRRAAVVGLFVVAALVILACAEHFATALVDTGQTFGISEFFLVQWLAPLASEAPELL